MPDTQSIWTETKYPPSGTAFESISECEYCVIGGGIAGLTTAYLLAKAGKDVVVLEAQSEVALGETAQTTAHLSSVLDDRFYRLESIRGEEAAKLAYESHTAAIDFIEKLARDESIACEFSRVPGYLCPGTNGTAEEIDLELAAAKRVGADVERVLESPFPRFPVGPCLKFANQGQFHPLKYLAGVARCIRNRGGKIFNQVRVEKISKGPVVHLQGGHTIKAQAVVVATNSPLNSGPILNSKVAAYTTYALAAEIPSGSMPAALYWDTEDPYHYVRVRPAETRIGGPDLLIVGGEDHKTGQFKDQMERWQRLESWARLRFPMMEDVRYRWSGQVFETLDGLALIGHEPGGHANVYLATGDSGMGLTHGTISGLLLSELVQGHEHPWAELYSPSRLPIAAAKSYIRENANMAGQFADWLTAGDVGSPSEVAPKQGALDRQGLKKVAVYCDAEGKTHEMSAICPHMGCIVQWNPGESTWDCPCHGSRFSAEGKVLHAPATSGLTAIK